MAGTGLELTPDSSGNSSAATQSGAECGALGALSGPFDPDLAAIVEAWPSLPEALRAGILAMVRAANGVE